MAPDVEPGEQFTRITPDPGERKPLSHSHILRSQTSPNSHEAALEEQRLLISSEPAHPKRAPRWVVDSSSGLQNFTRAYMLFLHLVIAILVAYLWVHNHIPGSIITAHDGSWSPAKDFVRHKVSSYWPSKHGVVSMYGGKPTPKQDAAWDDMLSPMYFAARREEVLKAGETIEDGMVEVTGGGYLATLGVYHELHCLRQLRLNLYQERYYHNLTDRQKAYSRVHLDHCLEVLRITIMCNGNTDMFTFVSQSLTPGKPTIKSRAKSVCVDWSSLEQWTHMRQLNESQHAMTPGIWNKTAKMGN